MTVVSALQSNARQLHGGARSFPVAYDAAIQRNYGYHTPTVAYEKLFYLQAAHASQQPPTFSAGWLIPDQDSGCNPVFVAHSLLSAIWLLRESLPEDTLDEASWQKLVDAAVVLATHTDTAPPSAQTARDVVVVSDSESDGLVVQGKRPAPSSPTVEQASPPKRRRGDTPGCSPRASEPPSTPTPNQDRPRQPQESLEPSEPSPIYVRTITSNNRRADRARQKRQAAAAEKKRQSIGLVEPPESAEPAEKVAYHTITPADDPDIAWIIKQPTGESSTFFAVSETPYKTACTMLRKARTVGSQSALYAATTFLRSWRTRGTPVPSRAVTTDNTASTQLALRDGQLDPCDSFFQRAWSMSHYCEKRMVTVMIEYRWAMALLGRAYYDKVDQITQADRATSNAVVSRHRGGKGKKKAEAINALLQLVNPTATPNDRKVFAKRLARAKRWFRATQVLGWGSLCLMPTDTVSNGWVERDIHPDVWNIWLQLVKRVNPEAHSASLALDNCVGQEGIQGGPIQTKEVLCIEEKGPTVFYEVEEIADSADEQDSDGGTECSILENSAPRPLRQLTLQELFRPQNK